MPKRSTNYSRVIQKTKWKPKLIKYKPNGKAVENIYIGTGNARRWIILKKKLEYRSDVDFVAFLLDLAEPFSNNDKSAAEYEENNRDDDEDDEEKLPAELEDETNDSTSSAQPDIADDCEWKPAASHLEGALRRSPRTQTFPLKLHVRRSTRNIGTEDAADHKNKTQPKEAKKKEKKIKIDSYSEKQIILGPQRKDFDCSILPDVLVSLEPLQSLPHLIGSCGDLQTSTLEETPETNIDEDVVCSTVDSSLVELATQEKSEWVEKVAEESVGNEENIVKLLDIPDPVISTEGRAAYPLVTPGSEVHIEVGERVKLKRRKKRCHATQEALQTSEENCDSLRGDHSHSSKRKRRKHKHGEHSTKKKNHDIRKAPQDGILMETTVPVTQSVMETDNYATKDTAQPSELGPKQIDSGEIEQNTLPTQVLQRVAIKIKLCSDCNHRHIQDACPLHNPVTVICDSIMFNDWQTETFSNLKSEIDVSENYTCDSSTPGTNGLIDYGINKFNSVKSIENGENDTHIECSDAKRNCVDHSVIISPTCDGDSSHHLSCRAMSYEEETCDETSVPKYDSVKVKIEGSCTGDQDLIREKPSYARASLPAVLDIQTTDSGKELCVLARCSICQYTQFGPLVGQIIKEKDIPDDFSMKHIWEVGPESERSYISTMDADSSSWIRYVRPAPTRDLRNVVPVSRDGALYLVTLVGIQEGEELLYWADDTTTSWARKKMEKTNCGGCNLRFTHPLYYRLHCTVFHDPNFSLTIRKYHCKVCGTAVLGKENIMKHAAEMHDGKGAYQCQYCKKFFLRLNYLEMHRTYGCASNPQRTRPLCDFCGRKFCQPQKLKVHIKRMHSDMADVLREFQCKICLKLLGSRAALQRHMKEVHHKDIVGACTCDRCGKMFQNKSNLKIHMLTHSGVKPFKCRESGCVAAFTTKQCLQFHYKKVHSFSDESMPVIERSVAYTFDAYSGGIVEDPGRGKSPRFDKERRNSSDNNSSSLLSLDDSSSASSLKADISGTSSATDCNTALEDKPCADEPPSLTPPSPPLGSEVTCQQPPMLEPYTSQSGYSFNNNKVLLSKGSKKWLGDAITTLAGSQSPTQQEPPPEESEEAIRDVYDFEDNKECDVARRKPPVVFQRAESSNASLLVEAAIDAVERDMSGSCSVANSPTVIATCDMDCGNQYSVSVASVHQDSPQRHMESYNLHQPEELISPATSPDSGLHQQQHLSPDTSASHMQHMDGYNSPHPLHRMDPYTVQHHEDLVSPAQTPRGHLVNNYEMMSPAGTPDNHGYGLHPHEELVSPAPTPTPRYELHHQVPNDNLSSGDEGEAQNLSLGLKGKSLQLDLAAYKQYEALEVVQEFGRGVERVGFEPLLVGGPTELQGLDMSARSGGYHPGFTTRYGVLYDERQTVDLSVAGRVYPPSPPYLHSVDLSLARPHPHHRGTPNHLVPDVSRTSVSQVMVDPGRMVSPPPHPTYQNYPMSPSPYHPASRPAHITSTSPTTYHHYSGYY